MNDKFLHLAAGFIIASPLAWFGYPFNGVILAGVVGMAKEAWDMRGNGTPDIADFIATLVGGMAATCLA